jgi:hypothetical protein
MRYTRLYADKEGQSHFEQVTAELDETDYRPPAPTVVVVSYAYDTDALQFIKLVPGWDGRSIRPPQPQFLIGLSGRIEVTASDGKTRTFGPGDGVLVGDTSGDGHRTRVKGDDEFIAAVVPLLKQH